MKIIRNSFWIIWLLVTACCCENSSPPKTYTIKNNYNVLLVPDLSNRIDPFKHPKPLHDTILLHSVLDSIPGLLKIGNRTMNQLDNYQIDFINRGILNDNSFNGTTFGISFSKFKNKLRDASEYKRGRLIPDICKLKKETSKIYVFAQNHSSGSDVWNYFNETIHSSLVKDVDTVQSSKNNSTIYKTKNIAVVLTDGYIETVNKTAGYSLTQDLVTKVRNEFLNTKSTDLQKFILSNPQFLIKKTTNNLRNTDVLVLELVDRSLDINGVARFHPTDLEIMKIIWRDWLIKSGAGRVEMHAALANRKDVYPIIKNFIENK